MQDAINGIWIHHFIIPIYDGKVRLTMEIDEWDAQEYYDSEEISDSKKRCARCSGDYDNDSALIERVKSVFGSGTSDDLDFSRVPEDH